MPAIDLSILNQRQTPAFYADVFANRPAAGFVGRIFVSTDTFAFYRDNGTGWDLIGGPGTGTVTGSGAAGQVAFWSGASLISGENNLWWDSANNHLGINTNTPATALDVNHNGTLVAKFNNTTSANSLIAFENAGNEQWWIGTENTNNDFLFYDATNFPTLSLRTTFKTSGQVLIGGGSTGSGKLVVESATSDNGIQIVGANAPSLRIDSAATGPTKRIGLGISTGVNNFIQGSVDRDMCIFNGSTTASPILFGIYDAGAVNVQEAARISAARNFLIGTTTDNGSKLNVNGVISASGRINSGGGGGATASINAQQLSGDDAAIYAGGVATTGSSKGIKVLAGTNTSDYALNVASYANSPILYARGDGNIGFGTSTPNAYPNYTTLTIDGVNGSEIDFEASGVLVADMFSSASQFNIRTVTSIPLIFSTAASERARFTSSGNLLIGKTTDTGAKLQVNGKTEVTTTGSTTLQTLVGTKTAAASGVATGIAYVGYTNSVRVYMYIVQSVSSGATVIADITTYYGSTSGGITTNALLGNVTGVNIVYNNSGYQLDVTVTYTGAAPTIYWTIEGLNNDGNIYAL